jgi:phage I-like protein
MTVRQTVSTPLNVAISAHASALPVGDTPPEWIQIMPAGKFNGVDGRGPYQNTDPAAIVAASMKDRGLVPLDYNHQTVFACLQGGEAPAAAWFDKMEVRDGEIWGHLTDWTPNGQTAVASKSYRFVSPAFKHTKTGVITRIDSVGLVNNPNLAALPAIASQLGDHPNMDKFLEELRKLHGLAADADEATILASCKITLATASALSPLVTSLGLPAETTASTLVTAVNAKLATATGTPDPSQFVPMSAFSELQNKVATMVAAQTKSEAETAVNAAVAAGKVTPAMKKWATDLATSNLDSFQAWAAAAPAIVAPKGGSVMPPGTPGEQTGELDETQLAVCSALGLSPDAYKAQLKKENA